MTVLGVGMAVSVAPLTTTVMNSVAQTRAGIASGINNAVSRVAGLLAIAVLRNRYVVGIQPHLDMKLSDLPSSIRQSLDQQRAKLAAADLPQNIPPAVRAELRDAIDYSFVAGFRAVMFAGALLAAGGAICAWWLIKAEAKTAEQLFSHGFSISIALRTTFMRNLFFSRILPADATD